MSFTNSPLNLPQLEGVNNLISVTSNLPLSSEWEGQVTGDPLTEVIKRIPFGAVASSVIADLRFNKVTTNLSKSYPKYPTESWQNYDKRLKKSQKALYNRFHKRLFRRIVRVSQQEEKGSLHYLKMLERCTDKLTSPLEQLQQGKESKALYVIKKTYCEQEGGLFTYTGEKGQPKELNFFVDSGHWVSHLYILHEGRLKIIVYNLMESPNYSKHIKILEAGVKRLTIDTDIYVVRDLHQIDGTSCGILAAGLAVFFQVVGVNHIVEWFKHNPIDTNHKCNILEVNHENFYAIEKNKNTNIEALKTLKNFKKLIREYNTPTLRQALNDFVSNNPIDELSSSMLGKPVNRYVSAAMEQPPCFLISKNPTLNAQFEQVIKGKKLDYKNKQKVLSQVLTPPYTKSCFIEDPLSFEGNLQKNLSQMLNYATKKSFDTQNYVSQNFKLCLGLSTLILLSAVCLIKSEFYKKIKINIKPPSLEFFVGNLVGLMIAILYFTYENKILNDVSQAIDTPPSCINVNEALENPRELNH